LVGPGKYISEQNLGIIYLLKIDNTHYTGSIVQRKGNCSKAAAE